MLSGVKISALPAVPSAQLTDIFPVVQAGVTSKETVTQLISLTSSTLTGTFVPIAGGTMTGPLILSADATQPKQAVTYEQLLSVASGLTVVLAVQAATTVNLNATFTPVDAGVGTTLTNAGAMAAFVVDGYSGNLNDRILVKNQTSPQQNGIYVLNPVGSGSVNWVLTRSTDYDTTAQVKPGTLVAVNNGIVNATTSWLETATVTTMDTSPILFSQFTFSPSAFLLKANNLSDLSNVATALVNLGLGVPTGTGNVVLQTSPTLITPILGVATATSLQFSPSTGGIIGTTTNNNAVAGDVGEYISSINSTPVGLSSDVAANITSVNISAGDWNIEGNVFFEPIGSTTNFVCWTSLTSASTPSVPLLNGINIAGGNIGMNTPYLRVSVAAPTTVYLSAIVAIGSGSCSATGAIYARRVR